MSVGVIILLECLILVGSSGMKMFEEIGIMCSDLFILGFKIFFYWYDIVDVIDVFVISFFNEIDVLVIGVGYIGLNVVL